MKLFQKSPKTNKWLARGQVKTIDEVIAVAQRKCGWCAKNLSRDGETFFLTLEPVLAFYGKMEFKLVK